MVDHDSPLVVFISNHLRFSGQDLNLVSCSRPNAIKNNF